MKQLFPRFTNINIARNESWLHSVWLGSVVTFCWLPAAFWAAIKTPIKGIFTNLWALIFCVGAFVYTRGMLFFCGLAGFVSIVPLEELIVEMDDEEEKKIDAMVEDIADDEEEAETIKKLLRPTDD